MGLDGSSRMVQVWFRTRATVLEQLSVIDQAAMLALEGVADPRIWQQARRESHRLAGSLGSLGSPEGTKIARALELQFADEAQQPDALALASAAEGLHACIADLDTRYAEHPKRPDVEAVAAVAAPLRPDVVVVSIDDDPAIGAIFASMLGDVGISLISVHRPIELWDALERVTPTAILLDVDMPDVNGIDLCRALRSDARNATTAIIVVTGAPVDETLQRAFEAGADDYISKPVIAAELIARVSARAALLSTEQDAAGFDVIFVEDDDATAAILEHVLEREGHRWLRFSDGNAALALVDGNATARVILLDVGLPGLDGFAVLGRLADAGVLERSRVVMLTARTGETEILRALELGAFDHIEKPFSVPILVHRIKRALKA